MKFGGKERFLIASIVALGAYLAALAFIPPFNAVFVDFGENVERISVQYGYWGAFISSILSNATIMIPAPNTAIILLVAAAGLNPWLLGILAGIGAGIGELTSYAAGYFGSKLAKRRFHEQAASLRNLLETRPRFTYTALFLVGLLPIPDDIFMIPLGLMRYNIVKAVLPFMIGKIVITTAIALFGAETTLFLPGKGGHDLLVHGSTLFGTILLLYAMLKVNWEGMGARLSRGIDTPKHNGVR